MEADSEISSAISNPTSMRRSSDDGTALTKSAPSDDRDYKRRKCISTACIACRKRKSKCDGAQPACAACVSVYNTECIYDPSSDHRRKGVYKKRLDYNKVKTSTLLTLVQAILNYQEDEIPALVAQIRACENLDEVASSIKVRMKTTTHSDEKYETNQQEYHTNSTEGRTFESRLASRVSELKLDQGAVRIIGGTSNLLFSEDDAGDQNSTAVLDLEQRPHEAITSWTTVISDKSLIIHLLNHYFTWHYPTFPILPKESFYQQFYLGMLPTNARRNFQFCTSLLLNAMLAIGCHFTSVPGAYAVPQDPSTAGDHFFHEAKRQVYEQDELAKPSLATIQALALMSLREAGCGRESQGWVYSGMAFRMVCDLGLNFHTRTLASSSSVHHSAAEEMEDARRVTFWGCFIVDKCWSLYLGRLPMFQLSSNTTTPKFEIFPVLDSEEWTAYYDLCFDKANSQPSHTRTVALLMSELCEISGDIIRCFYHPQTLENEFSKAQEIKSLQDIRSRLEKWNYELSGEFYAREGALSSVLIMHMMFQLLHIHLFRPFLKYNQESSPLPSNMSPRRFCTQAAAKISQLFRLYSDTYGLRQIVNIAVYICHSACTIHLLNLPEEQAKRDIIYGFKHLEEIAEGWICARRTILMLHTQAQKWSIELPEDAAQVLLRISLRYGSCNAPVPGIGSEQGTTTVVISQPSQSSRDDHGREIDTSNYLPVRSRELGGYDDRNEQSVFGAWQGTSAFVRERQEHITPSTTTPASIHGSNHTATEYLPHEILNSASSESHSHRRSPKKSEPTSGFNNTQKSEARKRKKGDMFGGVEALLRESNDWLLNDQASVASGFNNWTRGAGRRSQSKH